MEGRPPRRDFGIFDSDIYQPKTGPKQVLIPESFQLSAYSVEDGKRIWWVRGLPCEMKSVASL